MFGKVGDFMKQVQTAQKLMKDDNFKAFISHPKVQKIFQDPEFQEVMKTQDPQKIMTHPKMAGLHQDPEILTLLSKLDLKKVLG